MTTLEGFLATAERIVYGTLATVDARGRPRSRVVHPVWQRSGDGLVGWVGTRPGGLKERHVASRGFASCSYWDPAHDVAVAECEAAWVPAAERREAWERLAAAPAPMGYDPWAIWPNGPEGEDFAALRLEPWRVQVRSAAEMAAQRPYRSWAAAARIAAGRTAA